ncbi:K02A2.6-like [Cordylochernes scorpioides]|uniref:K02A2.6-like n=1 Tax=Cordylochernes scorpioides TaxID=51811 RepID=A0ABY6L0I7_9ARAC|nr:K02A2.6-like [Cordylochernes scorpioides]
MSLLDDENIPTDSNMDDYDEYIENYLDKIARTRQVVINNTEKTQERMKINYDKKHNEKIYEPGHLVAVWTPKLSNVNYLIEPKDNPGQDPLIVHVSRLKPYFERIDERFVLKTTECWRGLEIDVGRPGKRDDASYKVVSRSNTSGGSDRLQYLMRPQRLTLRAYFYRRGRAVWAPAAFLKAPHSEAGLVSLPAMSCGTVAPTLESFLRK